MEPASLGTLALGGESWVGHTTLHLPTGSETHKTRDDFVQLASDLTVLSYVVEDEETSMAASEAGAALTEYVSAADASGDERAFSWFSTRGTMPS